MARLSLTTCRRRQKRNQIIVVFWNQIMTIVVWFFITVCMLIIKYKREDDFDEPMEVSHNAHIMTNVQSEKCSSARSRKRKSRVDQVSHNAHIMTNVQSEECSSARSRKRKSRVDPIIEGITNVAILLGKELHQASVTMNQALQAEVELHKKISMVSSEISKIQSMSVMDRFKASRKIMREIEAVLNFWNLEGEERETFVKLMLQE